MGTPDFAVPSLTELNKKHEVLLVVTKPDAQKNRGKKVSPSEVKTKALELGLEVSTPERVKGNVGLIDMLRGLKPEAIAVTAYGKILPKEILDIPKYGCINVHASLLPKFRGAAPVQRAILAGETETGVTIMRMAEGMDTGDMFAKETTPIGEKTASELWRELSVMGAKLLCEVLAELEEGKISAEKQDDSKASFAPFISKEDGRLDFGEEPAAIVRRVRALDMWPGCFTAYNGETMKIWDAIDCNEPNTAANGTITGVSPDGVDIAAGGGTLRARIIQMPGKKAMPVSEYLKGNNIEIMSVLG